MLLSPLFASLSCVHSLESRGGRASDHGVSVPSEIVSKIDALAANATAVEFRVQLLRVAGDRCDLGMHGGVLRGTNGYKPSQAPHGRTGHQ